MKNKWIDIVRAIIVSIEVLMGVVGWIVYVTYPELYGFIVNRLFTDKGQGVFLIYAAICSPYCVLAFRYHSKILFPKEENNILLQWDGYDRLKRRAYIGLVFIILGVCLSLISVLMLESGNINAVGFVYVTSTAIAYISAISLYIAANTLREIIESKKC